MQMKPLCLLVAIAATLGACAQTPASMTPGRPAAAIAAAARTQKPSAYLEKILNQLYESSFRDRGEHWYPLPSDVSELTIELAWTDERRDAVRFDIDGLQASDHRIQGALVRMRGEYVVATDKLRKLRGEVVEITF